MEPGLHSGDAVVALEQDSYGVGDAVVFQIRRGEPGAGSRVIHRIVGGNAVDGFKVQGDNKDLPDFWRPTESEVIGKMWFSVPNLGNYSLWLRSPINIAAVAGLLAFLLYVFDGSKKDDDEPAADATADQEPQQI
jgi:signal peptidase